MKKFCLCLTISIVMSVISAVAQIVKKDVQYAGVDDPRRTLDVFAPAGAKDLPVVFWIHGGGWTRGDKTDVKLKPQAFMDRGFVFVSINYRFWPAVEMGVLIGDVAKAFRWTHEHIAEFGGDPKRVLVGGHSAGAQLAAIICTDEGYLKAEGIGLDVIKGCVPVDGDTYNIPAMIDTAEVRLRVHGYPPPTQGHRVKFGNDPAKHLAFSPVTHVAKGKGIPPFLILYVADHPDNSIQSRHFAKVLTEAGVPAKAFGAPDTKHVKLNDDLGLPGDPATKELDGFIAKWFKKS